MHPMVRIQKYGGFEAWSGKGFARKYAKRHYFGFRSKDRKKVIDLKPFYTPPSAILPKDTLKTPK